MIENIILGTYNTITLALAVAAITMTVSRSSLFRPIRVVKVLKCPYCLVHWFAFLAVFLTESAFNRIDFIIMSFAVISLSVPIMYLIELFMDKIDEKQT